MAAVLKDTPPQAPSNVAAEDDVLKRSTDCVYFLASPLTCKKGDECEYRHSEVARSNPTDCRYWLNGKCGFNIACVYRHPPLDVLVQPQAGKQVIPCYYFLMGSCTKGSNCTYLHGTYPPPYTKIKPFPATPSATDAFAFKKPFGSPEKNQQPKTNFHSNATKETEAPRQPKVNAAPKAVETEKHYPPVVVADSSAVNESWRSRAEHSHRASSIDDQNYQNGEDSLRESSPGFDVLVDDKLSEEGYHHNEEHYVRMRDHEGRRSSELDTSRHDEYNSVADVDHDVYRSKRGYDAYDDFQDRYGRRQNGASFERLSAHDMRVPYNPESPDFIQSSSADLRHRLSNRQRKGNTLRSVISHDYKPNYHQEDRDYRNSRRDARSSRRESSIGNRFQGRINPLRRSSPEDRNGERYLRRSSPSRPRSSSLQGRLRDRLGRRVPEDNSEDRNFRLQMRRDTVFHSNGDAFAGPRSLSEIVGGSERTNRHQQLTGQQSAPGDISFDGPKPLSEILKRKRNVTGNASAVDANLSSSANNSGAPSSSTEQAHGYVQKINPALINGTVENAEISNKKVKLIHEENHPGDEVGLDGGEEEPEVDEEFNQGYEEAPQADEEFDEGEGEYDYEEDDEVEGYNLNEIDVADNEGFMDEEEGDDFAKKLGVSV